MNRLRTLSLPVLFALSHGRSACAHAIDAGTAPAPWWLAVDPVSLLLLTAAGWCYSRGVRSLGGGGRDGRAKRTGARWFWSGWITLLIALGPPLDPLGGRLFSAHMLQHEILMLVSAPLLVLSRPFGYLLWGLPRRARRFFAHCNRMSGLRACGAWLVSPPGAWSVHAVVLWGWHLPFLFAASLANDAVHALQHSSFFVSALLFWWALLMSRNLSRNAGAVIYLFTTALHSGVLGALLTFAPTVWYAPYQATTQQFGLSALEDQQLGGLIMWVPSGLVFLAVGLMLLARCLRADRSGPQGLLYGRDAGDADG